MEHPNQLTYPISPDYVKSWTTDRAIAELIANALDEDPDATATWADGELVIADTGAGIPEEGLILGYSPKDAGDIGQFGEGAKIASLVLARATDVTSVHVETVGYGFIPTVETRNILDGIAPRRNAAPPQVLVYTFVSSARTRGTEIRIGCSRKVAERAIARFRQLSEPGYTRPERSADILTTGARGRLYIGGVLVSTQPRFVFSYDFPLAAAKSAQNRDRTVIDAETMTRLVGDALAGCFDEDTITAIVEHVLAGGRLSEPEKYFAAVTDPRVKAAFRAVGARLFAGRNVFYTSGYVEEAALDLLDGDFELLTTELDSSSHMYLMELLGVERAARAARTNHAHNANRTRFVARTKLTAAEIAVLDAGVAQVRAVFGASALDKVKVYTDAANPALTCADGFYSPADRSVAVRRGVLADPVRTMEVLVHEAAHRRGHMRGGEFADRTRGFENILTAMLGAAVTALTQPAADPADTPAGETLSEQAPPERVAALTGPVIAEVTTSPARAALAALIADRLPAACTAAGVADDRALSDSVALHRNYLRLLTEPRPVGWRLPPSAMSPSVVGDYRKLVVLGNALGIRPAVLWLGHMLGEGPRFGRPGSEPKPGRWGKRALDGATAAVEELAGYGGVYAEAGDRVAALAAGEVDSCGDPAVWTAFALDVLDAERARLGLG